MEVAKISFFKKIKYSIFKIEKYQDLALEKVRRSITYMLKIVLIFSLILSIVTTNKMLGDIVNAIKDELPEFEIKDDELILYNDTGKFVYDNGYGFYIEINQNETSIDENSDVNEYPTFAVFLKDKFIIKQNNMETINEYKDINLQDVNKTMVLEAISKEYKTIATTIIFASMFIIYFIQIMLDIFVLSIIGLIISKITKINFKYKNIFNISTYAVTLSVILYFIYLIINILTGFTISYFRIAYNTINCIYLVAAMLIIRTEAIKQQIEVQNAKKIHQEVIEEDKKDEEKRKDESKEKNSKKRKKNQKEPQDLDNGETTESNA